MPIPAFDHLTEDERIRLINAPAYVTVLIAGADENIDRREKLSAAKLVHYRTFTSDPLLHDYYESVNESFEEALNGLISLYEDGIDSGGKAVSDELSLLNPILEKLDPPVKMKLVDTWRSLAKKVAEASGGLLGYGSINMEERSLITLPMLNV